MTDNQRNSMTVVLNPDQPGTIASINGIPVPDGMLATADNLPPESLDLTDEAIDLVYRMFRSTDERRLAKNSGT